PSSSFSVMPNYSAALNWTQWRALGHDTHSFNTNPGLANPAGRDFSRPSSVQEMNVTYGGRTWTRFGAWQPAGGSCTVPAVPALTSPANGITGLLEPILVDWSDVSTATSYQVQIDNSSEFSSPLKDQVVAGSNLSASGLTASVTLYWRVRAQNSCGSSGWSASRTFNVGNDAMCGDGDGNDLISVSDAVHLLNYVFAGGPAPTPIELGDVDDSGFVSVSDAAYLVNYIFAQGAAPICP
ncbi:MAG: hypothetical protein WBP29_02670, partial [Candidatus Zixiibacteriota bacterium]